MGVEVSLQSHSHFHIRGHLVQLVVAVHYITTIAKMTTMDMCMMCETTIQTRKIPPPLGATSRRVGWGYIYLCALCLYSISIATCCMHETDIMVLCSVARVIFLKLLLNAKYCGFPQKLRELMRTKRPSLVQTRCCWNMCLDLPMNLKFI